MIGGNITGIIQTRSTTKNSIGESVKTWSNAQSITGWLDYSSGDSKYTSFNAKIQESTHVFVSDYVQLDNSISEENSRMMINGKSYDVMLIDNPMGLNYQLEIYLKFTGGGSNG